MDSNFDYEVDDDEIVRIRKCLESIADSLSEIKDVMRAKHG